MKNFFYLLAVLLVIYGCSGSESDYAFKNDFEGIWGWSENSQIRRGNAHSGNFCIEVNANDQYSMTFKSKLNDLSNKPVSAIRAKAWVKFSSANCKAKLVVRIDSAQGAPPVFWNGTNAEEFINKPNAWTEITISVNLPKNIKPEHKLFIYVWCNGNDPVLVDDVSFEYK